MNILNEIIQEEWSQFQLVNNQGGRATCQDNWQEFEIMRKSQFMAWPQEILASYYNDLIRAREEDRNLLFEKYAFMMKDTDPEQYERLKAYLPELSEKKKKLIDDIVYIQVKWAKEFEEKYLAYARKGRPIHKTEETLGSTSIESYHRGELCSYGEGTVELYWNFVAECVAEGKNLLSIVRENMAKMHGYESLEDANKRLGD